MDKDVEEIMKTLQEENTESPIRNDFGAFLGTSPTSSNVVGDFLGPTPSSNAFPGTSSNDFLGTSPNAYGAFIGASSNVVVDESLSTAKQEVFKCSRGTNNFGSNVASLHYKTLTEEDLNTNNLIFESRDWEKAPLAKRIRTTKDVHVVDPLGIWRTVKWKSGYWNDEKKKLQFCCEMNEWKAFAEGNTLETGDEIHLYKFGHTRSDLFALGYEKKEVKMPLPDMPTSNPQNPYVDPFHVQQQQYNSPFPDATLSNQQTRLPQITVPRASVIGSTFHTTGSSSAGLSNHLPLVPTSNPQNPYVDPFHVQQQYNSPFTDATLPRASVIRSTFHIAGSSSAGPSNPLPLVDHNRTSTDDTLVGNQQQNTSHHAVPRVAALPEMKLLFRKQVTHDDLSNLNLHGTNALLLAAIRPGGSSNNIYIQELGDYHWWRVQLSIIPNDGYEVGWSRFVEDKGIKAGDKVQFYKLSSDDANEYEFVLAIEKQQQ